MFRKLHSNRDPRDTLLSELKKEFQVYVEKGNRVTREIAVQYPRLIFSAMVLLLIASVVTALFLHRKPATTKMVKTKPEITVLDSEMTRVLAASEALMQTILLRRQVDSISAKKELNQTDSLTLIRALDSLRHIQLALPH